MEKKTLFLSHRMDRLVDLLAERLLEGDRPLLAERWILLPGTINRQWLSVALAERMPNQAIAGIKILGWREALLSACRGKSVPERFELGLALSNILEELPDESLSSWLKKQPSRKNTLIRSLSRQMKAVGFEEMQPEEGWQQYLFQKISVEGPWRFPFQLLSEAAFPSAVAEVHCFGVDELPSGVWDFLLKFSNLSIYLFSPCQMFWEDVCTDWERKAFAADGSEGLEEMLKDTHPLLANWGKLGRNTMRKLSVKPIDMVEDYEGSEEDWEIAREKFSLGEISLLEMVRHDLLFLRTEQDAPPIAIEKVDGSIEIAAAGSSKLRELQILKENLFDYLEKSGALCQDILVLSPDIREYEPLIRFVFGEELPWRSSCGLPKNPYNRALELFFKLTDNRWEVDDLLELLENSSFRSKWSLTVDDLQQFRTWMDEAQVRGSWGDRRNDWADGLKRMLFGLVYLLEEEGPPRIRSMDFGQAERFDLFLNLIQSLQAHAKELAFEKTLEDWSVALKAAAKELFTGEEGQEALFNKLVEKVKQAATYFEGQKFPFSLLRMEFEEMCKAETSSWQESFINAVQFASLQPGAIRPARAIFLLGLDREHFLRKKMRSTLDWESRETDPLQEGRYLLLEALFMAKERLYLSYNHLSAQDGKSVEPALPLQELLETLNRFYPLKSGSFVKTYPVSDFQPAMHSKSHISWVSKEALQEERRVFELSDLLLLARNPWKYFLKKGLGIYLEEDELFSQKRLGDFKLSWVQEQRLLRLHLKGKCEDLFKEHTHLFPPGRFGDFSAMDLAGKTREWKSHLLKWGIHQEEIVTVRFSKECLEKTSAKEGRIFVPAIFLSEKKIEIHGDLDFVTPTGILRPRGEKFFSKIRYWPEVLAHQIAFESSIGRLYLLDVKAPLEWCVDAKAEMERWVEYALAAEKSLSPLIEPWAKDFLNNEREKWLEKAKESIQKEDPSSRWILDRMQPLPLEKMWEEWSVSLQKMFAVIIGEAAHESV